MTKTSRRPALWSPRLLCLLGLALLPSACMTGIPRLPDSGAVLEPLPAYHIGPGDALSVKLFYTAELNEEVWVRPDGRISLQLVGDVPVAGRTPEEVAQDLRERYSKHLSQPDVAVIVTGFASQKAFVGGEVKSPSMVPIDGRMTLADAIFQAGGPLDTAATSSVILLRKGAEGTEVFRIDLGDSLEGEDPLPVLRPYDVVFVPKSVIAKVGMYVDLYINRIIPKNAAFTAFYQINPVDPAAALGNPSR